MHTNTRTITVLQWAGPDCAVRMIGDLVCPNCFRPLRPSAVRRDGAVTQIICEGCHVDILTIEPVGG